MVKIEIDSGAARSILTEDVLKTNWFNNKLEPVSTNLRFFDGSTLQPIGQFKANVSVKNKSIKAIFLVIKSI